MADEIRYYCAGKRRDDGSRESCGTDITDLIRAVPEDGKDYETTCPKCGCVASVMRSPPATE